MKFQVVNLKPMSGISKANKPYNMLIVSGIFTNPDGTMEVGETIFMEGTNRPLPVLTPGKAYTPLLGARVRDGKLSFEIAELKPLVEGKALAAA
jgi:hypothetical protein